MNTFDTGNKGSSEWGVARAVRHDKSDAYKTLSPRRVHLAVKSITPVHQLFILRHAH